MKENTTPASTSVSPLAWKIILTAAVILVMGMLAFTVYSIANVLRVSSSPPTTTEINAGTVSAPPNPSGESSPAAVSENSKTTVSAAGQPPTLATQFETFRQREQARTETIEALKRAAQERAGTNAPVQEELKKIEQSDPYIQ